MLWPTEHSRLEKGAIDDQLRIAFKQVEQANLARWPVKRVFLLHRYPRHPSTLCSKRITGPHMGLLFHEKLPTSSIPLLLRDDRGYFY
jgi:hypothetical protein